ncbi:unnamed protein product [Parascedosporium putredinis]|uniref:Ankyrin repeat protein n=1 Tax=Parascedosporium putredinis TaxID=1442378 RepID=A0A9P1GZP6_9PEZI|nr:unnamed protein product [Parascedosporium putredinis]CAI7991872.1 unnamed protein product [Parascedosporium putredinis]
MHILLDIIPEDSTTLSDCLENFMVNQINTTKASEPDLLGRTCLHIACSKGFDLAAAKMVEGGASYNVKDSTGRTAVHWAALRGCRTFLAALSDHKGTGCLLHDEDHDGHTPLSLAVKSYEAAKDKVSALFTLSILHQMWMEYKCKLCKGNRGWGVLHYASALGLADTVQALLSGEFMPYDLRTNSGETPLAVAAEEGHLNVVKVLCSEPTVDVLPEITRDERHLTGPGTDM